ncbi:VENN motif pre-toxin domain-containing protein [Pectobacterium odoriferum]|uniref:VENN motif pre-toxin domain-containing protein n=1 Tax=Pectobacterium odoriferum TaxID=78398 RepID=UPI0021565CDE|nr:VENN motif pre-toxin domain-containing protein [Pectobacterium odoriferum]
MQDITTLSRDVEHANNALSPIFNKEKEQKRLKQAQLIGEIGAQVMDIVRTEGELKAQKAAEAKGDAKVNRPQDGDSVALWEDYKKALTESPTYKAEMQKYGTGSDFQRAAQAATAAIQALAGGDIQKAIASGASPYLAQLVKDVTIPKDESKITASDIAANAMAHAVVGAVVAQLSGQDAAAGAIGASSGELIARAIMADQYPGKTANDLTEEEKQSVSALSTLASGLVSGLASNSTASAASGAQSGRNAVENNFLSVSEKSELEIAKQKLKNSKDLEEREQAEKEIARLTELDISRDSAVVAACGNGAAGSAACAAARVNAYQTKAEYENTGNYNSRASQQYADAYGQIVNLLNITSVDAQNQQQVTDAMINYFMVNKGVDYETAKDYVELKKGAEIVLASVTPILGEAAAKQLSKIVDANLKVVAKGNVDGAKFSDTNQGVRPSNLADFNKPTLIDGVVQAKIDKRPDKNFPNGNMGTAHAEVGVIQQAFDKGMTNGKDMLMSVSGEKVCSYCSSDVVKMAQKSGLKSLTIYEEKSGDVLHWESGMTKFTRK